MNLARIEDFDPVHIYVRQMLDIVEALDNMKVEQANWKKVVRLTEMLALEMDAIKVVTDDKDIRKILNHVDEGCKEIQLKGLRSPKAFNHGMKQIRSACQKISLF